MTDAEIAALVDAATAGPWASETGPYRDLHWGDCGPAAGVTVDAVTHKGFFVPGFRVEDAQFIAASRSLVPDLLARAQRAEGERDEAKADEQREWEAAERFEQKMLRAEGERDTAVELLTHVAGGGRFFPDACGICARVLPFLASLPTSPEESKGERT